MKKILVPLDGSDHAFKALDIALHLADPKGAEITLLHVTPTREIPAGLRRFAEVEHIENGAEWLYDKALGERMLAAASEQADGRTPRKLSVTVHSGDPATGICKVAEELGVDAVVLGSRGLSEIGGLVMGSVSRKVSNASPCTVITVR